MHHHDSTDDLSVKEKLAKLLDHWIQHNNNHADTYREWGGKAREEDLASLAGLLEDAADLTEEINHKFREALKLASPLTDS